MAYAFVQEVEASSSASSGSIASPSITPTGGNLLHCAAVVNADTTVTFTDTSTSTFSNIGSVREAAIASRLFHAYAEGVAGGADTVTATFGASGGQRGIYVLEISGLDTTPLDGHNEVTDTGDNPTTANSITPAAAPGVFISIGTDLQGGLYGTGSGMTQRTAEIWSSSYRTKVQYKNIAAAGATSATFVNAGFDRGVHVAAVYDEATVAAADEPASMRLAYPGRRTGPMALRKGNRGAAPLDLKQAAATDTEFGVRTRITNNRVGPMVLRRKYRPPTFPFDTSLSTATTNRLRRLICSGA